MSRDADTQPQGLASTFVGEELVRCNRCGLCLPVCPTYRLSAVETDSARGRNALLEAMRKGQLPLDAESAKPLFECLVCGACTETCPTSVDVNELIVAAREEWHRGKAPPWTSSSLSTISFSDLALSPFSCVRFPPPSAVDWPRSPDDCSWSGS